jgi:hypothetical protein
VEAPGKATGTRRIGSSPEGAIRPNRLHSMAMLCIAMRGMAGPVGGGFLRVPVEAGCGAYRRR